MTKIASVSAATAAVAVAGNRAGLGQRLRYARARECGRRHAAFDEVLGHGSTRDAKSDDACFLHAYLHKLFGCVWLFIATFA